MREILYKAEACGISLTAFILTDFLKQKQKTAPLDAVDEAMQLHRHSTFELFIAPKELTIFSGGEPKTYQKVAILVPPRTDHYIMQSEEVFALNFTAEELPAPLKATVTVLPLEEDVLFYVSRLADTLAQRRPAEQAEHLVSLLFSSIFYRLIPQKTVHSAARTSRHINALDVYISGHYKENINLEQLAAELYLCPRQVSRIIKKEYGCTLSELLHRKRLTAACTLLRQTDLPLAEIARGIGYEYESYFFTRFKKEYGCTPAQYRNKKGL